MTASLLGQLTGAHIAYLNEQCEGLGNALAQTFSFLTKKSDAQAGHNGPVFVAKQKQEKGKPIPEDAMKLQGGRVGDAGPAVNDDQYVTLGQVRAMLSCDNLINILADCIDNLEGFGQPAKPACQSIRLANPESIATGLSHTYAVEVLDEFVYVLGD